MRRKRLIRPTDSMRFVGRIRCASIASDNKCRMRPTFTWRFLHLTVFIEVNQTTRLDNLALFSSQTFHIERNFRYRRIFMDHITFKRRTRIIQRRFNARDVNVIPHFKGWHFRHLQR
ncbi:hypothetical protein BU64_32835 [Escherichia coli O128:H2 str. 2011C-3317]|nr:hypothetical protein BU64_32835 [Escherichia coli O128:H2 str. 2011C-3317]